MSGKLTYTFARHEKKYILTQEQRETLMELIGDRLQADSWGRSTIRSLYCDTPSKLMIRRSLEHPIYKEKIRIRSYKQVGEGDKVFLELKKKVKGITYKRRAPMPFNRALAFVAGEGHPETQIEREIAETVSRYAENIVPTVLIACEREAFFCKEDHDLRLTFDMNVRWSSDASLSSESTEGKMILDDGLCILEIKCGDAFPLWLTRVMSEMGLFPVGCSKYGKAWQQAVTDARKEGLPWTVAMMPASMTVPTSNPPMPVTSHESLSQPMPSVGCGSIA